MRLRLRSGMGMRRWMHGGDCTVAAELAMRNQKQTAESLRCLCGLGPYHLVPDHVVANHILVHTLADPVLVERMRCDERTVDVLLCELKAMAEAGLLHMSLAVVEVAIGCMYAHVRRADDATKSRT